MRTPKGVHDQREPALQSSPGSEGVDPQTEHPREGVPLGVRPRWCAPLGGARPLGVRAWGASYRMMTVAVMTLRREAERCPRGGLRGVKESKFQIPKIINIGFRIL